MENLDDAREVLDSLVARMSELEERNLLEDFLFQDVAKAFRCVYMARMNLGSAIEGLEQSGAAQ